MSGSGLLSGSLGAGVGADGTDDAGARGSVVRLCGGVGRSNNASARACLGTRVGGRASRVAPGHHLTLAKVVDADRSDVWDGAVSGSSLAKAERLVKSIGERGVRALRVQALVECVLELSVVAETLAVTSTAGDVLGVGPALGDTA